LGKDTIFMDFLQKKETGWQKIFYLPVLKHSFLIMRILIHNRMKLVEYLWFNKSHVRARCKGKYNSCWTL